MSTTFFSEKRARLNAPCNLTENKIILADRVYENKISIDSRLKCQRQFQCQDCHAEDTENALRETISALRMICWIVCG